MCLCNGLDDGLSDQLQALQAGVTVAAEDDVVVDDDAERVEDSMISRVIFMSAAEGVGSPEGWLWARMMAVAESSRARRATSRG